jgi:hypothetical protein
MAIWDSREETWRAWEREREARAATLSARRAARREERAESNAEYS